MTSKKDYSEKDWKFLVFAPSFAATGAAAADGEISRSETYVITEMMLSAADQYKDNELITSAMKDLPKMLADMNIPGELRYAKTPHEVAWAFGKIAKILDKHATAKEASEFKTFLLEIVDKVANAPGGFLNLFGNNVSEEETDFTALARKALCLDNKNNR